MFSRYSYLIDDDDINDREEKRENRKIQKNKKLLIKELKTFLLRPLAVPKRN
jgi:hypothetical protein